MFWNYAVTALRCFKKSISTYLVANTGLAIGLTCVLLISYYVTNQLNYDRDLPESKHIYRLDTAETYPGRNPLNIARAPGPVGLAMSEQIPGIEAVTRGFVGNIAVVLDEQKIPEVSLIVDPNFLDIIQLPMITGNSREALASPNSVVVSKEIAIKYFGKTNILGQKITIHRESAADYIVTGVMDDLTENSHMAFDLLLPIGSYFTEKEITNIRDAWNGAYFHTYLKLSPNVSPKDVELKLPDFVDKNMPDSLSRLIGTAPHNFFQFKLVQLQDIHLYGAHLASMKPGGNLTTIRTLIVVSLMTMVIAAFNFSILGTTQATLRSKEVAMRKVLGAGKAQIRLQFLGESFIQAIITGLIAAGLSEILLPIVEAQLGPVFGAYPLQGGVFFLWLLTLVILSAFVAGMYPALFISQLKPASIFNPTEGVPAGANMVRDMMVVLQVLITAILVTVGLTMFNQQQFIKAQETWYDSDRIVITRIPQNENTSLQINYLKEQLLASDNIEGVAVSSAVPSDGSENNLALKLPGQEKPVAVGFHTVDENFLQLYNIDLVAGRLFSAEFGLDAAAFSDGDTTITPVILNTTAARVLGYGTPQLAIGQIQISAGGESYLIVGVVPDIRFRSLKDAIRPEMFLLSDAPGYVVSVKYAQGSLETALHDLRTAWIKSLPNYPHSVEFLDDLLNSSYEEEDRNTNLIIAFAVIAMLLSCVGLIAILRFTIRRRRRELAIRRLYGARIIDLLIVYSARFFKPLLIANLLSWPISFYVLHQWLAEFETRIDLDVTPFAISTLGLTAIAAILLLFHVGRIRSTRPSEILRSD